MASEGVTSYSDLRQFSLGFPCGCSYVAWRAWAQNAESFGWLLCPDHMAGFHAFRVANRCEFRIKHPCHCYYVVRKDVARNKETFGFHLCMDHGEEYSAFQRAR